MEKIYDKKYIIGINHDGKEVFYNKVDGDDVEFVGIRSKAHHFDKDDAESFKAFLNDKGHDAWVETFYVLKEELKIN